MLEIITVDQLRKEIGDPTRGKRFADNVQDAYLQEIIDFHTNNAVESARALLSSSDLSGSTLFQPVSISLTGTDVKKGAIPPTYFPFAIKAIGGSGKPLDAVRGLEHVVYSSPVTVYGFDIHGANVFVSPSTETTVTLYLANEDALIKEYAAAVVDNARKAIIKEASDMLVRLQQGAINELKIDQGVEP